MTGETVRQWVECYDVDMTEPAVGGGGLLWWPAGVLIRGGCTLERGERGERRASGAGDHGPVTPGSR